MKLQNTLTFIFTSLIINNVYAMNADISKCNEAVDKRDAPAALTYANNALKANKNDKDALICKGRALSVSGDVNGAVAALKTAADLSVEPIDKMVVAILTGNVYKKAKQYDLAINSYNQAASLANSQKNKNYERISINLTGDSYFEAQKYAEALVAYTAASKLTANDNERGESYENIAITHHKLNQNDLALEYQIKAYFAHQNVGTLDQYAHSSAELGRYYTIGKNYIAAENTLNKIIKLAKEQGSAYYEAQGYYLLAKVKVATGDKASAVVLIEKANKIAEDTKDLALAQEIREETAGMI